MVLYVVGAILGLILLSLFVPTREPEVESELEESVTS
jgi:hypothetical protein